MFAPDDLQPYASTSAVALHDYRAQYHTDPDLRALRESAPIVATWDDGEVANNYADEFSSTNDTARRPARGDGGGHQAGLGRP